ncbi:MAG: hypothetical protein R2729_13375 [Bryobacteraceae bacterium]
MIGLSAEDGAEVGHGVRVPVELVVGETEVEFEERVAGRDGERVAISAGGGFEIALAREDDTEVAESAEMARFAGEDGFEASASGSEVALPERFGGRLKTGTLLAGGRSQSQERESGGAKDDQKRNGRSGAVAGDRKPALCPKQERVSLARDLQKYNLTPICRVRGSRVPVTSPVRPRVAWVTA